jgi:hypothetical protein
MKTGRPFMLLAGMAAVLGLALAGVGRAQMRLGGAGEIFRLSLLRLAPHHPHEVAERSPA